MTDLEVLINNITISDIDELFQEEFGRVVFVQEEACICDGLINAFIGEIVYFSDINLEGMILELREYSAVVLILGDYRKVSVDMEVKRTKKLFYVSVSNECLGQILNGYGKNNIKFNGTEMPIFTAAPTLIERAHIQNQIFTGINIIDFFIPIGFGQREVIVGNKGTGKTSILQSIILNNKNNTDIIAIYVSIGQSQDKTIDFISFLQKNNITNYIMVVAGLSDPVTMRYFAPLVGCSIGEYFRNQGKHAIVFMDDLSNHASAYREIALLLKISQGRDGYPGDIFYLHSSLLERAGALKSGGSMTCLPIVELIGGELDFLATNVISITDGQIYMDDSKFAQYKRPAIGIGLSVSRVGTQIQPPYLKELCRGLKLTLAQANEYETARKLGADTSSDILNLINFAESIEKLLYQSHLQPLLPEKQIILLHAIKTNKIAKNQIDEFINYLHSFSTVSNYTKEYAEEITQILLGEMNYEIIK